MKPGTTVWELNGFGQVVQHILAYEGRETSVVESMGALRVIDKQCLFDTYANPKECWQ